MHNARFMLVEGLSQYVKTKTTWVIISSSNKVARVPRSDWLNPLINHGTVGPNNFGHYAENYASGIPENQILTLHKVVEHHGYFRTLKDVRDYIQMLELMDNV
ncbi:hypothetical protein HYP06_gp097 [Vibrio phage vB_VspP_pVa5]|uniref:Uncharacterized protein n=1 Tax=Vibrio phage vB_VspP_pVa5 TaxID=1913109 RepID=A0A1J0GV75_9CAUD|nr:hypothetical protein HYP06_gp097 [Vibrio phage vB_VspP_pVa5]APC46075.1 hypothetical protein vBVspPpVa5_0076 [Vibrio phage vB_VspP_pVa5]